LQVPGTIIVVFFWKVSLCCFGKCLCVVWEVSCKRYR